MKKIAILSFYHGNKNRGVESWVSGLEKNLSKEFDIRIFSSKDSKITVDWKKEIDKRSILRRYFFDYWSLKIFEFNLRILRSLFIFSPDIVLATDGGWEVGLIRIFCWLTFSKMVIVGQAGIGFDEYNNLFSFPDVFVALTEKATKWARRTNPFIKVIRIPNAVDTNLFTQVKRTPTKNVNILSVGALEKGKRHDLIINAVSKIPNANLTIVGEGVEKENLIKLSNEVKLEMEIKSVEHSKIYKEFEKADLFVSASESYYAFEIVLIEALATNLPVVANNDEIRKEIVEDAGKLVDVTNVSEFSKAIKEVLNINWKDIPRRQSEKFSWNVVARKYSEFFNNL